MAGIDDIRYIELGVKSEFYDEILSVLTIG